MNIILKWCEQENSKFEEESHDIRMKHRVRYKYDVLLVYIYPSLKGYKAYKQPCIDMQKVSCSFRVNLQNIHNIMQIVCYLPYHTHLLYIDTTDH